MEKKYGNKGKQGRGRANRILIASLAVVLCAGAVLTGILLSRKDRTAVVNIDLPEDEQQVTVDPEPTPVDESRILPVFAAPAVGLVTKGHDLDVLVFSRTTDDWRVHCGIDISANTGDPVLAAAAGVVKQVVNDPMWGTTVVLSHNGDAETVYRNLAPELPESVTVGAAVSAGEVIGCVGESAILEIAEEPHLHFEMKVAGAFVDPMAYISEEAKSASLTKDVSYEG